MGDVLTRMGALVGKAGPAEATAGNTTLMSVAVTQSWRKENQINFYYKKHFVPVLLVLCYIFTTRSVARAWENIYSKVLAKNPSKNSTDSTNDTSGQSKPDWHQQPKKMEHMEKKM